MGEDFPLVFYNVVYKIDSTLKVQNRENQALH